MSSASPLPAARISPRDQIGAPVLVIEDQRSLALLLKGMLQDRWGCEVNTASTLGEARELLAAGAPYLAALCDLNLPDAEHGEVIDSVKQAGIPVIAMTAAFGDELRESILKKGVVDYVLKDSINAYAYVCDLIGRLAKNRGVKVLAVDDSLSIRALLKQSLEMYGLEVLVARDGLEGLEMLRQHPDIRVMLVDYNMPGMDGFHLTMEARKTHGKDMLAIIGISGNSDPMFSARFLKNGANDFIHKPFYFEEVICRVNQNLDVLDLIETNRWAANHDFLTGLHNRRHFFHEGRARHALSLSRGEPTSVAMLDLDHFKQINDHHGHECGDTVLKLVANQLARHFQDQLAARLGGEEFAVLLTGLEHTEAMHRLESFRESVARLEIETPNGTTTVTVSIGLTATPDPHLDNMVRRADEKLYLAKTSGRNRLICEDL